MKRVLSWGLGLQSTTLGVLSALGQLPPLDLIITADPGWERERTYKILDYYKPYFEDAGIPVVILDTGNVKKEGAKDHIHIPFWTETGAPLRRQCTKHFKIAPIRRYLRDWLGFPASTPPHPPPGSVEQWIGFTIDERERMSPSDIKWQVKRYPLIEMNWARWDCPPFLRSHGLPVPIKSACIGCPYRSAAEWLELREEAPEEWREAVQFDDDNRGNPLAERGASTDDRLYIWREAVPLADANLKPLAERERQKPKSAQLGFPLGCDDGYCHI
jgi:hypothetical protein